MTAPDFPEWVDIGKANSGGWSTFAADEGNQKRYIRADAPPEAFAALPQVQNLIAAAVLEARSKMDCGCREDRSDCLCKSGNVSFCYREGLPEAADITPADASAALARMLQEADDRGLERAAQVADAFIEQAKAELPEMTEDDADFVAALNTVAAAIRAMKGEKG